MEPAVSSLIAGVFGAVAAAIPVWAITRRQPSRAIMDAEAIVQASGVVIAQLTGEVSRLRDEVSAARGRADAAWSEVERVREDANLLRERVGKLATAVRVLGGNPDTAVSVDYPARTRQNGEHQ